MAAPPATASSRTVDIEIGSAEVITIDLDELDSSPDELLEVLSDGSCKSTVWLWTKLAAEYWKQGNVEAGDKIGRTAVQYFTGRNESGSLTPIYALLSNIQLAQARKAPKLILPNPRQDDMTKEKPQDHFYKEALGFITAGDKAHTDSGSNQPSILSLLARGISQLALRNLDDALRSFENVLHNKPNHMIALMGKARILYVRRMFPQALKVFQHVLQLDPYFQPDPRIGIGLCFWAMDNKSKARAAWERSVEVNKDSWPAQLLLGLDAVNASKNEALSDAERTQAFVTGTKRIERAFHANQRNAAAANALCEVLIKKNMHKKATKLAERTIQFADTLTVLTEGYTRAGRLAHTDNALPEAVKHFTAANETHKSIIGSIGLAQVQMKNDEIPGAIHTLDTLLQSQNAQNSLEATAMLASLCAYGRPGISSADNEKEKTRARELFDTVCKALDLSLTSDKPSSYLNGNGANHAPTRAHRRLSEDVHMYAEIARLWQAEDLSRAKRALREGLRNSEAASQGRADPRLMNNIGVIHHLEGDTAEARQMYENALTVASASSGDGALGAEAAEAMSTSILYNLGRVYEELGEDVMAKQAYEKLISRHPEYVDAKVRQAQMLFNARQYDPAHDLLKQALISQNKNLDVRAAYTHFLIQTGMWKEAKGFVYATLNDVDKGDVYALCASASIMYHQARESRGTSPEGIKERQKGFQRAAEFYGKALQLDPSCVVAAQGLAIVIAEDALGSLGGALPPGPSADDASKRVKNARDALDVLSKVRESMNDGSVYVNMGHCFYNRDEYERAIESYETASKRYYKEQNAHVLLYLCRAWFAKSSKEQSFDHMNTALSYAQQALKAQPNDKAVMYNIAMIQQKVAQMLFAVPPAKRSLQDLEKAIEEAKEAQKLLATLASDPSPVVPYDREMADERRKYGENMLRKAGEHIATQQEYEAESNAKREAARLKRQEEYDRRKQLEDKRHEESRLEAERLVEQRRAAREQAQEWTRDFKAESDEEREKKAKRASRKAAKADEAMLSGDDGNEPPKRKRRTKKKAGSDEDEEALFSAEEDGDKPAKKRGSKKRVVRDEDDEEIADAPRRKSFKSKEIIGDSDEEMA